MAKQGEIDYLKNLGADGVRHALNKPFSDGDCAGLLMELANLMALLPPPPAQLLDLGCGTGWLLGALAEAGVPQQRLQGVDLQPARVAAARRAVPDADIEVGDVRRLELPDGGVTLVFMLVVLSSLDSAASIRSALGEARRLLQPGGLLLCYEPRLANPLNRNTLLLRDRDLDAAGLLPREQLSLTLLPPLARRLGSRTEALYGRLSRLGALRTHRLVAYRASGA